MDLIDAILLIIECFFIGLGMELGSVIAKVITVKVLNSSSPVTVHDGEDEEEEEEEEEKEEEERKKKHRRTQVRSASGASTPSGFRVTI